MTSRLAIFDLNSRTTETVLTDPGIIEAPNWAPDPRALIVNKEGRLFRVDLDRPELAMIDTGFATSCNNDHGLSPDGRLLAISDRSKTDASCIYVLPVGGGRPRRVTRKVPSYWHGWSPEGHTLAYVGKRGDAFDIYTVGVDGGAETRLTNGFEHTDGPDYSRDGQWIWFNGQRNDVMDLWRIKPDGTDLEQMTNDAATNWFPHPNPKGDRVLYIAYAPKTPGHPRDHDVSLRLLQSDGSIDVLYEMIGGQGSINVPCWSPDGTKFAFVETI